MHQAVQKYVDDDLLVMAASVVLEGQDVVDFKLWGQQDRESGVALAADSIYRIFSNTKLITSVAAMMLWEDGKFQLDDPLEKYLPALKNLDALREGATEMADVEPAAPPTVRQVMCHNAGFSYGIFAESLVDPMYLQKGLSSPGSTLEDLVETLGEIPLANQPGRRWQYSVSTDVLARLVEVWSGMRFDEYLKTRIFEPLGMVDTDFRVPASKHARLCGNYVPVDLMDPMKPGLKRSDDTLLGSYLEPKRFLSGGGGLVSTIIDYTRFIQMIVGGGVLGDVRIVEEETLDTMRTNQLPEGLTVQLPNWPMPDTLFGLGFAIRTAAADGEPATAISEYHWGGMAGTHSWMSPRANIAGIIFTQRLPGFLHPFSRDFRRLVYQATA